MTDAHTPAGWYQDQTNPSLQRWWDGSAWTHHTQALVPAAFAPPPAAPAHQATRGGSGWTASLIVTVVGSVVAMLGSLLPWATVVTVFGSLSVSGTEGDGVITLVLSLVAAVLAIVAASRRRAIIATLVLSVVVLLIAFVDLVDIANVAGEGEEFGVIQVGIGLWLVAIGALAAAVSSVVYLASSGSA